MVLGMVWYNPKVLGSLWMKLAGVSPEAMGANKAAMITGPVIGLVMSIISAYVLAYFGVAWGVMSIPEAIELAFWVWIGFQMPIVMGAALWEMKSWKLVALNGAYQFLALVIMAVALVTF